MADARRPRRFELESDDVECCEEDDDEAEEDAEANDEACSG